MNKLQKPALIAPPPSGVSSIDGGALQALINQATKGRRHT